MDFYDLSQIHDCSCGCGKRVNILCDIARVETVRTHRGVRKRVRLFHSPECVRRWERLEERAEAG
jgi:hypothetical protein